MKFELDLTDAMLAKMDEHLTHRALVISIGMDTAGFADQVVGMVLGAAKAAGWGKKGRKA